MSGWDPEARAKARQAIDAGGRRYGPGERPLAERWWWYVGMSGQFWVRIVVWPFSSGSGSFASTPWAVVSLVAVVALGLVFVRERRLGPRKRASQPPPASVTRGSGTF